MGIDWVYDFTIVQWIALGMVISYAFLWIKGVESFKDPERRFLKITTYDDYYVGTLGDILMFVRNLVGFLLLLGFFLILV